MELSACNFELTFPSFDSWHLPSLQSLIDEVAPSSFTIVCLPMKEGDLLRLLPELDRVPLPPALMFWVCAELPPKYVSHMKTNLEVALNNTEGEK